VRKTSVYLSDREAETLRMVAIREDRPQAEIIREGVRLVLERLSSQPVEFRSMGKGRGPAYEPWSPSEVHRKVMGQR
jgi:hypothetical protein